MLNFLLGLLGLRGARSTEPEVADFCALFSRLLTMPSQTCKSEAYNPSEFYSDCLVPLDGNLAAARRGARRRTAIDLARSRPSLELAKAAEASRAASAGPIDAYANMTTLQKGRLSKIVRALHTSSGEKVVLKIYDRSRLTEVQADDLAKEIDILGQIKGYNGVIELKKTFVDDYFRTVVLCDCSGGNLLDRLAATGGRMAEEMCVRQVVKPLVDTLAWLHGNDIVHRDIKPEHILFDGQGNARLTDFFSAAVIGKTAMVGREGTLAYMAPEVVTKPTDDEIFHEVIDNGISETDLPSYDEKVDVWSLGVVVVEILTGHQPFLADTPEQMATVQKQELQGDRWGGVLDFVRDQEFLSLPGQDFLSSILRIDPKDRPRARDLQSHPWLDITGSDDGSYQLS
eukprot:evm.model.scf_92.2 EVM.evm.TU.scf_92.2   scf_92:34910-37925(+)